MNLKAQILFSKYHSSKKFTKNDHAKKPFQTLIYCTQWFELLRCVFFCVSFKTENSNDFAILRKETFDANIIQIFNKFYLI